MDRRVCVVGYNDMGQYCICKNSWGKWFGESGYFTIAYDECGIDSFMDATEGAVITGGSLGKLFNTKGIPFPVSIRTVAQEFGLRAHIRKSINPKATTMITRLNR
jgi:hypothetical protein